MAVGIDRGGASQQGQPDEGKLNELSGKMVTDLGAAMVGANVIVGDQLGLYKTLAADGSLTSHQLTERTGTAERYVHERSRLP